MDLTISRLKATLKTAFNIGKLTIDASNVSAAHTLTAQNRSGTIADDADIAAATKKALAIAIILGS